MRLPTQPKKPKQEADEKQAQGYQAQNKWAQALGAQDDWTQHKQDKKAKRSTVGK